MKIFVIVLLVQIAVCFAQKYTSRYDNLNLDQILSNKRVLGNYIKCVLDEGPCTAEGRELRKHIPEAIETSCAKCTDAQRRFVKKGATFVRQNQPKEWSRIARKFDPEGKHAEDFNAFLRS